MKWTVISLLVFTIISTTEAQSICSYFTSVPKEPRPNILEEDFTGVTWSMRPLIPAPLREDVCMDAYTSTGNFGTQAIYIEEEIEGEVVIAKLNYDGNQTPYVGGFLAGQRNLLNAVIRRLPDLDNSWYLIVTERQDYETPIMQRYLFEVNIEGETLVARVSLEIVNIDDNAPVINVFDTCVVPEQGEIPRLTECVYEVTDVDGYISTGFMTFKINSDRGDDQLFSIHQEPVANDVYRVMMTIRLEQLLNYETSALHIFSVTASDSLPNTHTVSMMVQVENVESRPPRWVEIWAVQQFDEKTNQSFTIRAIDGDTGINKPIYYKLDNPDNYTFFSIETIGEGYNGAIFSVAPIDRDELEQEVFQLSIIAYKFDNESFATEASIVIIVNDINDQYPEPFKEEYRVAILEETPLTLSFDDDFGFYDKDLGEHARYEVFLESVQPAGVADAFYIAPGIGYQRQTFTVGTVNHTMLDYEVPEFQQIIIRAVARDLHTPSFVGTATIYIDLINWNDEEPIFEQSSYSAAFNETEGAGFIVEMVRANDRDIGDRVVHSIMGNIDYLSINETTGVVTVSKDNAFDYHRQSEIYVQIHAEDTLGNDIRNTATTQLVIQLYDINNTPPTLRLPRGSPIVQENVPAGHLITDEIVGTDPDSTAELVFEIDWETSYATKQGRETPASEFNNCVTIETIYPTETNKGSAIGRVIVQQIREGVTIDFEEFEVLYLTVRVTDINTVIGNTYDELTFTIIVEDMNDNAPVWVEETLTTEFRVREVSATGVVIGSVLATDIDGPLYNQIRYSIRPREDTTSNLVAIDPITGQINVDMDAAISADVPKRDNLYYTVIASDCCSLDNQTLCPPDPTCWDTEGNITIHIIDTNNQIPVALTDQFETTVRIYENATSGDEIVNIITEDLDRDEIYHTVRFMINYAINSRLRNFFEVNLDTGLVYVQYDSDETLDRDSDEPEHRIFLSLYDNFYSEGDGNRFQVDLEVRVILLDVNDNAPELPPPDQLTWSVSENLTAGTRLDPHIYAPDKDEPNTDNSRVGYEILSLVTTNRDLVVPELFQMININGETGELETAIDLKGYWGSYQMHVRAYDHGVPQQSSNETYDLIIRPYNYHAPQFIYPLPNTVLRLARERAVINGILSLVNGELMERISASDDDGLEAGQVTFTVSGDGESQQYFNIINDGPNSGSLLLTQIVQEEIKEFQVTIRATDGGTEPNALSSEVILQVVFVPTIGEPIFPISTATVSFYESELGLEESFQLPTAEDPKNYLCANDCNNIFYWIIDGNSDGHFGLDSTTNTIRVVRELNRTETAIHTLLIAANNLNSPPTSTSSSYLTVTVTVREANPRPIFEQYLYMAGISTTDTISRELLTVKAVHTEGLEVTYSIDQDSMTVDPSLEAVRGIAFALNNETGILTLNIQPTASMFGMFEFDILATDPVGATDSTRVKIYLITSLNRVYFLFYNTIDQVELNRNFIAQTFSTGFEMTCNIDQIIPATNDQGVALSDITEVRAHFIRDDNPVNAEVIETLRSDTELLRSIQLTLNTELLILQDFVTGSSPEIGGDSARLTVYFLAGLSALLTMLCLVLFVTYLVRVRGLNRRLEALSTTKFGSVDSGLNRVGIAVPGTNKHALEGSNPIWSEQLKAPDFDALSDDSDDSDLIGVEDLAQFKYDYFPPENVNNIQDLGINPRAGTTANHDNNFGFNATPFTPEFANLRRK